MAPSRDSALPVKPVLWQKMASDTPVASCSSFPDKPHHFDGALTLCVRLPGLSCTACQQYPPRSLGYTTNRIFDAFSFFEVNRASFHGRGLFSFMMPSLDDSTASSTNCLELNSATPCLKTLSKTCRAKLTAKRKASSDDSELSHSGLNPAIIRLNV